MCIFSKEGALAVDSGAWEREAADLLESHKVSHLFLPVWSHQKSGEMQGVYFLWHFPAVTKQRWFGAVICDEQGALTAEFKSRFGAYLKHMHAVLERRGWLGRVYITTMDEPYTYHLHDESRAKDTPENNYRVIGNFVRFVRETAPGLRTFATADPAPGLNGLIDHWCLRNLRHAAQARERAEQFGETVTFCDNYRTFVDYPAVSARSLGWLAWKIGANGWLTYETLGNFTQAWEGPAFVYPHFGGGTVWGMGQLFYPDPTGSGTSPPACGGRCCARAATIMPTSGCCVSASAACRRPSAHRRPRRRRATCWPLPPAGWSAAPAMPRPTPTLRPPTRRAAGSRMSFGGGSAT